MRQVGGKLTSQVVTFLDPLLVFVAFSFIAFLFFTDEQSAVKKKTGYLYW